MWQFSFYVNKSEIRMGEKFFLQWNDFQATLSQSFRQLRQEKDFFDVTLVSNDEIQLPAHKHKLVLSACSGFFKSIFKTNAHSHPLLYLSGVTSSNLNFILDYIYQGEVQLYQEQLDSFLDTAQKLRIAGLLRLNDDTGEEEEALQEESITTEYSTDFKEDTINPQNKRNIVSVTEKAPMEKILVQSQDEYEVKSKINELLSKENGMFFCGSCGKSGKDERNMRRHIETHIDGVSYHCEMCGKTFRSKNSRNCHKSIFHKQQ